MILYCTACDQRLGSADELCPHRNPVGWCCCETEHGDIEHGGGQGYDEGLDGAA